MPERTCIGDNIDVEYDGWGLELIHNNGDTIYLEPGAYEALLKFVSRVAKRTDQDV